MAKLFHLDNPIWIFLGKLTDMVILTILWMACCIPLVTVGASTAALYDVSIKLADNQEGYIISSFFRSFRKNWKKGTAAWAAALLFGVFLISDFYLYSRMGGSAGVVLLASAGMLGIIYLMTLAYLFPFLILYDMDFGHVLALAFVTALKNPGWTLLMVVAAAGIAAVGIFVMAPVLIISAGLTAYIHAKILGIVVK